MIHVESYVKKGDVFIPIADFQGSLSDPMYIEGAIELTIGRVPLFTLEMWDYVDQLWSYLVSGLCEVCNGNQARTYFPDQPIEIVLTPMQSRSEIRVDVTYSASQVPGEVAPKRVHRTASGDLQEFVRAMTQAAGAFFLRMGELLPGEQSSYQVDLEKIQRIADTYRGQSSS